MRARARPPCASPWTNGPKAIDIDRQARVQRGIGILKHHLHLPVQSRWPCRRRRPPAVETIVPLSGGDEMHHQPRRRRLAAAGLADDTEGLALPTAKETSSTACTSPTGRSASRACGEMLGQCARQQWRAGPPRSSRRPRAACCRPTRSRRTSMAWRRPSLSRLKQIEVMKIMTPGSAATRG